MGIVDEDIERVRAASDIVAVVQEQTSLRKQGTRWIGLCPFHAEKTPSFSVNAELGLFYCFGCQAKGDVITFVREAQHLDFVGAVESLAGRAGIQLRYDKAGETGERRRRAQLVEAMERAVQWYHDRLLVAPDAAHARGYLRSRGYDGDVVRRFRLGWAPDGWDELCRALDLPADVLRDTGLGFVNKRDRLQDSFRARIVFPILDARGDPVALGGRVLPGGDGPKYKNSPSTAIYDKSAVLYGLSWAKAEIVEHGEVVVCEGYTDVIGFATAGIGRAVATCGTAFTERHVASLRSFAPRIVLAFDADAAGQGAAARFYEWEQRYELDVMVAAMPPGSDPGELAQRDPDTLRNAVAKAKRFLQFRVDRILESGDLRSVEGRARAAETAADAVAEHPNQIIREQYAGEIAVRTDIPAAVVLARMAHPRRPVRLDRPAGRRAPTDTPALMVLRLAVQRPEEVADLIDEVLFVDELHRAAFRALASAATLHEAIEAADPEAAELLQRLAVEDVEVEADDVVALLVADVARRVVHDLEAAARGADDPMRYVETLGWLKLRLEDLREPATRTAAVHQLLPFLVERAEEGT